jgi:catechol 2,3-dioxygenase-like lactoylglutathione lyase family enzyme
MQLTGIHHLTAISAKPRENLAFYIGLLGMRLVKKTVNQDDVSAYHLFYADGKANPGTDLLRFPGGSRAARHRQHLAHRPARRGRKQPRLVARSSETGRRSCP